MRRVFRSLVLAVLAVGRANVRQLWQVSRDGGKIWIVLFDGLYVPASPKE